MSYFSIVRIIASALLFIAILDLPYGYYTLMKIAVTIVAGYGIYVFLQKSGKINVIIFTGVAIIFNPLISVHFEKETWQVIDAIVGSFFLISLYYGNNTISDSQKKVIKKQSNQQKIDV
jgi:hypothetical protein